MSVIGRPRGSANKRLSDTPSEYEAIFWARVEINLLNGCWEWQGPRTTFGHGTFARLIDGERNTHRISYRLCVGAIPPNKWVLHKCDNPPCVNPNHLYLGTRLDNARDRTVRGRGGSEKIHGELNYNARLTDEKVRTIRATYTGKHGEVRALAREHGVSDVAIFNVLRRRTWRHVV